jgi:hypothetical protein
MNINNKFTLFLLSVICVLPMLLFVQCVSSSRSAGITNANDKNVLGFGFLNRIPGLWSGPVFSDTPAGSFPMWYVDFRPVSPSQVSQYTTLDPDTKNNISFFIVKHDDQLKVAMRTEGIFQNKGCVTYEVMDTAKESKGYYRFSDFNSGDKRAYTEFTFKKDELIMEVYTNKFNTVKPLQLHSRWEAKLADRSAALDAISHFNYPQPVMIKDFSDAFKNMHESIYFTFENDPYDSSSQPYVGQVTFSISIDEKLKVEDHHELFLVLITQSLFDGYNYVEENLKYISKCIFLPVNTKTFTFNNVHPGTYYLYSYIDVNSDRRFLSGDYVSSNFEHTFTLSFKSQTTVDTFIDFVIP